MLLTAGWALPGVLAVSVVLVLIYLWRGAQYAFPGEVVPPDEEAPLQEETLPPAAEETWPAPPLIPRPAQVKGIYLTGYTAGSADFPYLVNLVNRTELNAMIIDTKDDRGRLTYSMTMVPWAAEAGAPDDFIEDPVALMSDLAENGIYPIARITAFKDSVLTRHFPELAVLNGRGEPWKDWSGNYWLDPYNKENWKYIVAIAREAAELGFREIQFDYVRFPSDGNLHDIVYPAQDDTPFNEVIPAFLRYARASLQEYDVEVSADIFGMVTSTPDGMGIGQKLELLAPEVDLLCPMVYPSHYESGNFGLPDPEAEPYAVVYKGLASGLRRLEKAGINTALRPWLQAFTINHPYGPAEIRQQIQAAADLGVHEFMLWNAYNYYYHASLGPEEE